MLLKKFPHSMLEFGHNDTWFTKVQPEMMMSTTILGLNFRWLSIRELGENPLGLKCQLHYQKYATFTGILWFQSCGTLGMKGLLEIGVQKQIHRAKERLFESSKAWDVTEHLNNGNLVTNFRVLCVPGISSFSSPKTKLLQVSTKNCNLQPGPIPEVCDSQASCHSAHAQGKVWQV